MKKILLSLFVALASAVGLQAQEITFEFGPASWNIENEQVFDDIEQFNANGGAVLTYTTPSEDYTLTMFHMVAVNADLFIDGATEPVGIEGSFRCAPGATELPVAFHYAFVEGHSYKIVTNGVVLAQANLATFTTDTLVTKEDSYSISFKINGAELVKTINVESTMSLAIVDQNTDLTFSLTGIDEIKQLLGISDISEAKVYGLNANGSYNDQHSVLFDGWRDADGEYTMYNGGWDSYHGHNAYPAVYCTKITENADSILYYFYDYWKVYNPDDPNEMGGGTLGSAPRRAPVTSYNSVLWEWDNGDGTTTTYQRNYRCDPGKDYKAAFAIVAGKKMVQINAVMHFVDYTTKVNEVKTVANGRTEIYDINGVRQDTLRKGLNIVKNADGTVKKIFK